MTTQVYEILFSDGKAATCIAMEPGTDKEHIDELKRNWCGKIKSVKRKKSMVREVVK